MKLKATGSGQECDDRIKGCDVQVIHFIDLFVSLLEYKHGLMAQHGGEQSLRSSAVSCIRALLTQKKTDSLVGFSIIWLLIIKYLFAVTDDVKTAEIRT